jgi:4-amino-4-deoxy-L-arabinose transferase-like glycosyltransferase
MIPALPDEWTRDTASGLSDGRGYVWYAILLLICATAFFLAALISQGIFERIPHVEDEAAYLFQAQVFAQGRLKVPTPAYSTSYWSPFVLDFQGQRFGKYPPGYPLLLSLAMRAGAPWVVNALAASLTLWVLACAGRVIYSPAAGLLAAALSLTVPVFLAMSGTLLSHPTSLLFATLFLWAYASLIKKRAVSFNWPFVIVAGLALGYLLLTRPFDAIGVSFPIALYVLVRVLRGDRTLFRQGLVIAAIVVIFGLLLLAYWYRLAETIGNPYSLLWPYDQPGFGPNFGPEGYTLATGLRYLRVNLRDLATSFLGWPGYLNVLFLLVPFLLRPRDRWNYLLLASFLSLAFLHVSYWYYGGRDAGFPRYYFAGLPMLLLLTARGVELLPVAPHRLFLHTHFPGGDSVSDTTLPITSLPIYLALIGLVLYNGLVFLPPNLMAFRGKSGITAEPLRVVQEAGITHAIVFVTGVELWYDFAVFFSANSPTLDSDIVYAIYYNQPQARAVRDLFPSRDCYIQDHTQLRPCPF